MFARIPHPINDKRRNRAHGYTPTANGLRHGMRMMLRTILVRTALLCIVWWTLTGGSFYGWFVGLFTIVAALALSLRLHPPGDHRIRIAALPAFLAFFVTRSVAGGMQVAAMAMRPRMQLRPAMLEMHLRLPHETERILLASMLSLLPGTLSAGLDGNLLHLHVLDAHMPIEQEVRDAEARIARLFGTGLQ